MSESYVEVREDGAVRLAGTLAYPEATVDDVLTVQADGSIAAAPAGGSIPYPVTDKFSVQPGIGDDTGPAAFGTIAPNGWTSDIGVIFTNAGGGLEVGSDGTVSYWDAAGSVEIARIDATTGKTRIIPPTTDPHIAGALWNDGGTPAISMG